VVDPLGTKCRAGTGASVAQVPEPRPKSVVQVPVPQCQGCTGTAQRCTRLPADISRTWQTNSQLQRDQKGPLSWVFASGGERTRTADFYVAKVNQLKSLTRTKRETGS
jgi:hypothetical protein